VAIRSVRQVSLVCQCVFASLSRRGSYSYVAMGASGADYEEIARPIGHVCVAISKMMSETPQDGRSRVFFAGEHTNHRHPGLVSHQLESSHSRSHGARRVSERLA
jgi:hypothetical protein